MSMLLTFNVPSPVIFLSHFYIKIFKLMLNGKAKNTKIGECDSNVERWHQQER